MADSCFYYGVHTPEGYITTAKSIITDDRRGCILKSCMPSLNRRVISEFKSELEKDGLECTVLFGSDGIEGLVCREAELYILNGAHRSLKGTVIDADSFIKKYGDEGVHMQERKQRCLARSRRFLSACKNIGDDMLRLDMQSINISAINRCSARLWKRYGGDMNGKIGVQTRRFVSCITPDGTELNTEAFYRYCDKVININDKTGACSRLITDRIRGYALGSGFDVIVCPCTLNHSGAAEHLIIPELRLGVFTSKHFHRADFENGHRIYSSRFVNSDVDNHSKRIAFSLKAYRSLMNEAFASLDEARQLDREFEEIYLPEADVDGICRKIREYI